MVITCRTSTEHPEMPQVVLLLKMPCDSTSWTETQVVLEPFELPSWIFYGSKIWSNIWTSSKMAAFRCTAARGWRFKVADVLFIRLCFTYLKICNLRFRSSFRHSHKTEYYSLRLEGHSVKRMYLRQRCSDAAVNKTVLKPRLAAATGRQ